MKSHVASGNEDYKCCPLVTDFKALSPMAVGVYSDIWGIVFSSCGSYGVCGFCVVVDTGSWVILG